MKKLLTLALVLGFVSIAAIGCKASAEVDNASTLAAPR